MTTQKHMGRNDLVARLTAQVGSKGTAIGLLKKRGQMDASGNLTKKGQARNNMTAAERAVDRASKASGRSKAQYGYNPKTNRATLRKK
jgi:hypothetical protein